MKDYSRNVVLSILALLTAGYLAIPVSAAASEIGDSPDIAKLLDEAKTEAGELLHDSDELQSFTRSTISWETQARKIEEVKEHINASGKLLAKLKDAEAIGSEWQQTAIKRIEPLLRELAANTEVTIKHLNDNRQRVHSPQLRNYVTANYQLAVDLQALIRDFVDYGEAKQEFERLGQRLGVTD